MKFNIYGKFQKCEVYGMVAKWSITIPELSGKKKRNVYVYIPDKAILEPELKFPVLYMFDGHNVFFDEDATYGKSWGMKEYMDRTKTPMIIVAVECNHGKNYARIKEYSPYSFTKPPFGRVVAKGGKYMNWLINTLKPIIDSKYPTLPDRDNTYIAGSSMGGLMSLYAVVNHNDVFSRAACLSPSVWAQLTKLRQLIRTAEMDENTVIYMDYGAREINGREELLRAYSTITKELIDRHVNLTSRIIPNGDHCEACWEEQIPIFMKILSYKRK